MVANSIIFNAKNWLSIPIAYLNCVHVWVNFFVMNGSPNEAKVIAWKKNTKYEMRSKSSNKFQCVGPRQENMPTKLGSGKILALVKAKRMNMLQALTQYMV